MVRGGSIVEHRIKLIGLINGMPTEHDGGWLKGYSADRNGYAPWIESTPDPADALRFPTLEEAVECWKTVSKVVPLRPDGEPNRPLTAFSIEVVSTECST